MDLGDPLELLFWVHPWEKADRGTEAGPISGYFQQGCDHPLMVPERDTVRRMILA
jgi:hypothetical protein